MIVELIVTLVVASILILSLHTVVVSHTYLSQRSRDLITINAFAEHKIEALRSIGFLGLNDGTTNITSELSTELLAPRSGILTITSFSTAVKKIHLTITYNDQGNARTYIYATYIGELGVGQY